ncbi:T-cell surface glycoprotein CD8 alpha chain [Neolamprologus brichardi]|uniref:T-cell surface glycoprotein CD8 alpha chain n=1 Tax=Neolamprologus brichardi TaxID=32507 RepID=UPI0003EC6981|nr:T-cell surface glycoprotein CD8 alpha chain [Neolamprologus brichardi]
MDQKWLLILVIVVSYQKFTSGTFKVQRAKEGDRIDISCTPKNTTGASMIVWFRVLSNHMEFIGSFSKTGLKKASATNFDELYTYTNNRLSLKSFKKTDAGLYGCASLIQGNTLVFGEITQISADKTEDKTEAPPTCTTKPSVPKIVTCDCEGKTAGGKCSKSPIMLGALAGGCGLFLLLLIVTILYCNRIRTRRCPHHHKRRPRTAPPAKEVMPGRYV